MTTGASPDESRAELPPPPPLPVIPPPPPLPVVSGPPPLWPPYGPGEQAKASAGNLFARHWRGELTLGTSYWGIAFLGNLVALLAITGLSLIFNADRGYEPGSLFWLFVLIWAVVVVITTWQVVGTWRSATNHADRRMKLGKGTGWATAAKVMLVLGTIRSVAEFGAGTTQLRELFDMAWRDDPSLPAFSIRVMRGGTELEISGGIKYGLTDEFRRHMQASPRVQVVHLQSPGGRVGEAEKLRQEISRRGLITYVASRCESACTLVHAGGRQRWVLSSGKLGFHSPDFPGMSAADKATSAKEWEAAYASAGISRDLIERGFKVPSNDMWHPSLQELLASKAATNVSFGGDFAVSGYGANPSAEDLMAQLKKGIPALQAIQSRLPNDYEQISRIAYDGYNSGATQTQFLGGVRSKLVPLFRKYRSTADDQVMIDFGRLVFDQLEALAKANSKACYEYVALDSAENALPYFSAALIKRELELQERIILTAAPRAPASDEVNTALMVRVRQALVRRFGSEKVELFEAQKVPPSRYADYCSIAIAFYKEVLGLNRADAVTALRFLHSL